MAKVKIAIYDTRGRQVALLLDEEKVAGYHSIKFNASSFASGIYFYEIKTEEFQQVKKMMLIR